MNKLLSFVLVLVAVVTFGGCSSEVPDGKREVRIYFGSQSGDSLVSETGYVDKSAFKDKLTTVKAVFDVLIAGPAEEGHRALIPDGVTLRGVSVSELDKNMINIDLSGDYYSAGASGRKASDELLARYSIISTLCEIDGVDKVKIYINGKDLRSRGGKGDIVTAMSGESVHVNSPSSVETQTEKFVTLYFAGKDGKKLYSETRKATMTDNSIEKTVVTELIKGPVSEDLSRTFSADTALISIETTEDVCFVNFTPAFMSGIESGSSAEKLAVYSIVNSLTRIAGIEKVQILMDGKKPENDVHQIFSTPLEEEKSLIAEPVMP